MAAVVGSHIRNTHSHRALEPNARIPSELRIKTMKPILRALRHSFAALLLIGAALPALRADDAAVGAQLFDSPDAAMKALVEALKANDDAALRVMAGPGSEDVIQSGKDPIVARERRRVATMAAEKVIFETLDDGTQVAVLGMKAWPMPLPLAPKDGKWFFDVVQARDEILARRIGKNELNVIDVMRMLVEAQGAYKAKDRDGDGVLEYAQKFASSPGAKDGLFWLDPADVKLEDRSPLGGMVEELTPYLEGGASQGAPYSGYRFKMLKARGPAGIGGAQSYLVGENLTGGFGVLAVPAEYRNTGVKSFIVSHRGRVFESDLGREGTDVAKTITAFNPDGTWVLVEGP